MNVLDMSSKDNIEKNCSNILEDYGLPTTYLPGVLNMHYIKKQWIIDALGITEGDGFRKVFPLANTMDTRPFAVELLHDIEILSEGKYRMLDLQFMWKEKNKVRVTKVIQEMWDKLIANACDLYHKESKFSSFTQCCRTGGIVYPHNFNHPGLFPVYDKEAYIHRFHVWYGDYVKNGRVAVLSFNPFDFITASERSYCGFTSCVRPDGEYANTILDYMASDCVAIMYTSKPENIDMKEGRCWVYINSKAVFQGRVYGSIFDSDLLLVRDYIQQKLVPDNNYELFGGEDKSSISKWTKRSKALQLKDEDCYNNGTAYVDYGYGIMSIIKGSHEECYFTISEGTCLECGAPLDGYEQGYACSGCCGGRYTCECCGDRIDEDDAYYLNDCGPYCESCFDDMAFHCDLCGGSVHNDYRVEMRDSSDVCEDCFSEYGFTCYHCDDNFIHTRRYGHAEPVQEDIDGNMYCEKCTDRHLVTCEECEEKVHTDNTLSTYDDVYLCKKCFRNATYKSIDGKIFHDEDERDNYDEKNAKVDGQEDREKVAACG